MKTTIKFYDKEITLSGLKRECEVIGQAFDKLQRIKSYQTQYTGVKKAGVEPEDTTFYVMFGSHSLREQEAFTAKIEDFKTRIPAIVTLDVAKSLNAEMNQIFRAHVCIVDDRVTEEERAQEQAERKLQDEERYAKALEIEKLVNLKGEGEVTREVNEMFLTISGYFNDSHGMSDYFHPHHSIGTTYAIGVVPKGARREALVRDVIESVPELQGYTWTWSADESLLESSQVGIAPIKAYDGRTEVSYWYELRFSTYNPTMPKSRLFIEKVSKEKIEGIAPTGDKIATCKLNPSKSGIELYFNSKPQTSVLDDLKANGWRWSRFNSCWYKLDNSIARRTASKYAEVPQEEVNQDGDLVEAQENAVFDNFAANNL